MTTDSFNFLIYCAAFAALCTALFGPQVWRLARDNWERMDTELKPPKPTGFVSSDQWARLVWGKRDE
jgi:hypothetical protein